MGIRGLEEKSYLNDCKFSWLGSHRNKTTQAKPRGSSKFRAGYELPEAGVRVPLLRGAPRPALSWGALVPQNDIVKLGKWIHQISSYVGS